MNGNDRAESGGPYSAADALAHGVDTAADSDLVDLCQRIAQLLVEGSISASSFQTVKRAIENGYSEVAIADLVVEIARETGPDILKYARPSGWPLTHLKIVRDTRQGDGAP